MNLKKLIFRIFLYAIYVVFIIGLSFGGIYGGIWAALPSEFVGWDSDKLCYLGYDAHCSFTPFSTIICFILSIIGFVLLKKVV